MVNSQHRTAAETLNPRNPEQYMSRLIVIKFCLSLSLVTVFFSLVALAQVKPTSQPVAYA